MGVPHTILPHGSKWWPSGIRVCDMGLSENRISHSIHSWILPSWNFPYMFTTSSKMLHPTFFGPKFIQIIMNCCRRSSQDPPHLVLWPLRRGFGCHRGRPWGPVEGQCGLNHIPYINISISVTAIIIPMYIYIWAVCVYLKVSMCMCVLHIYIYVYIYMYMYIYIYPEIDWKF